MKTTESNSISFSKRVESEVSHITKCSISQRQAVIAGVFCTAALSEDGNPSHMIKLNKDPAECIIGFLRKEDIEPELDNSKADECKISIPESNFDQFDTLFGTCFKSSIGDVLSGNSEFARSFLRGAFISCGYCSNPEKAYRIELHLHNTRILEIVKQMLSVQNIQFVVRNRKSATVICIQNGNDVSDFLGMIGAMNCMLEFENVRAKHELYTGITRTMNCDLGNTKRQADAGAKRDELILKLMKTEKWDNLPENLKEAGRVQVENPGASITELGKLMKPPLGKSGMNHRLNKLLEIAKGLD